VGHVARPIEPGVLTMRIEIAEIENRNIYRVWHDGAVLVGGWLSDFWRTPGGLRPLPALCGGSQRLDAEATKRLRTDRIRDSNPRGATMNANELLTHEMTHAELDAVSGGVAAPVVCKYPADPEQTCGTKGPGPHVPVLS
jgi:hypothetical protein